MNFEKPNDEQKVNIETSVHKKIKNELDLIDEITNFSEYLNKEYEALYPIVLNNDLNRDGKNVHHLVQNELERRLDLVDYIRNVFQERIEGLIE